MDRWVYVSMMLNYISTSLQVDLEDMVWFLRSRLEVSPSIAFLSADKVTNSLSYYCSRINTFYHVSHEP